MTEQVPPTNPPIQNPHKVGFIESRWRMLKSGVKGVLSYLTKPKTYLYAAGFGVAFMLLPSVPMIGDFFTATAIHSTPALLGYVAKMVTIGALFHMGSDMIKEGQQCCHETKAAHQLQQQQKQQQEPYQPYDYGLSNPQYKPLDTPTVTTDQMQAQKKNTSSSQVGF